MNENTNRFGPDDLLGADDERDDARVAGRVDGAPASRRATRSRRTPSAATTSTRNRVAPRGATSDDQGDMARTVAGDPGIRAADPRLRVECRRRSPPVPPTRARGRTRSVTRFQKLAAATVVTTVLLVTIGVVVRATGFGHGLPRLAAVPRPADPAARRQPGVDRMDPPHGRRRHRLRDPRPRPAGLARLSRPPIDPVAVDRGRRCWSASRRGSAARPSGSTTRASR